MSTYEPTTIRRYPRLTRRVTGETRYWKRFKFPVIARELGAVTSVTPCAASPYDFVVTSGLRVHVYSSKTSQVKKTLSRFRETAYSGVLRDDGRLLAAGSEDSVVQVFDIDSKTSLRKLEGHTRAAHVARWARGSLATRLFSCADDATVRAWDITSGQETALMEGHQDYVRCGAVHDDVGDMFVSGGYDHTVRLWDVRAASGGAVMQLDHGAPVEAVLSLPGGGIVLSAGGDTLKVWDILGGGRLLQMCSNHHKAITSLAIDSTARRVLTGSLDRHVKVYDTTDFRVCHSFTYAAPVLSVALSNDDAHLFAGMTTGLLSMRHRAQHHADSFAQPLHKAGTISAAIHSVFGSSASAGGKKTSDTGGLTQRRLRTGTYRYFVRGKSYRAHDDEVTVVGGGGKGKKKLKLRKFDVFLKRFQYGNALDSVLNIERKGRTSSAAEEEAEKKRKRATQSDAATESEAEEEEPSLQEKQKQPEKPVVVVSVLDEIIRRGALKLALTGRDTAQLVPLLHFLVKHIANPRFADTLIHVSNCVFDIYASMVGHSMKIDELLVKLQRKIDEEIVLQRQMHELMGMLDMTLAGAR